MQVIAKRSFVGYVKGAARSIAEGSQFELPDGVDWVQAGFVLPVDVPAIQPDGPEVAAISPNEIAVLPTAKAKKATI